MKTVQMTLDEELLVKVDEAVKRLGTNRSAFTRDSLQAYLMQLQEEELETKQIRGYEKHPVEKDEFSHWEDEQAWVD